VGSRQRRESTREAAAMCGACLRGGCRAHRTHTLYSCLCSLHIHKSDSKLSVFPYERSALIAPFALCAHIFSSSLSLSPSAVRLGGGPYKVVKSPSPQEQMTIKQGSFCVIMRGSDSSFHIRTCSTATTAHVRTLNLLCNGTCSHTPNMASAFMHRGAEA
jgi:hypothetical protein